MASNSKINEAHNQLIIGGSLNDIILAWYGWSAKNSAISQKDQLIKLQLSVENAMKHFSQADVVQAKDVLEDIAMRIEALGK